MSGPRIIVLVGLMGSGKSAVARRLATEGIVLFDTDRLVERNAGYTVREVFARDGEDAFRQMESDVLAECLATQENAVVAAAGGAVVRASNRDALNTARAAGRAWVVWLRTDPAELARRVARGGHRPLLDDDPEGTLVRLDAEREPHYRAVADAVVDTTGLSLDEVTERVLCGYRSRHGGWGGEDA